MTEELLKYKEKDLLFLDIETVRGEKEISFNNPLFNTWQYKMRNRDTDELPSDLETQELYNRKAGLYPLYLKIVCITVGYINNEKIYLKSYTGEEKDILINYIEMLKDTDEKSRKTLVIWNADFDIPTIRQRWFVNKLGEFLPSRLANDSMKKPWNLQGILDLMQVWKGIRWASDNLGEVCTVMGLTNPKDEGIDGSMVSDVYYNEKKGLKKIVKYCERDVTALINLYRLFTYKEPIEEVIVKEFIPIPKDERTILQKAIVDSKLTLKQEKKLDKEISKLTKKEKEIAEKIKKAVTSKTKVQKYGK